EGTTLVDRLDELAAEHGLFSTAQLSIRVADLAEIPTMMEHLRAAPPTQLLGADVTSTLDLSQGSVPTTGLPPTEGLLLLSRDDTRVVVRPSGTEPKLKCYLEVVDDVPAGISPEQRRMIRHRAGERLEALKDELLVALGQA